MDIPTDRVYSESHEWFKREGDAVTIGLTKHAVDQLTDITYAEMRSVGDAIAAGDAIGEVESVKTTSDVYSLVEGEITEVNEAVVENPGVLNEDPYQAGWLVKLKVTGDAGPLDSAMDAEAYGAQL